MIIKKANVLKKTRFRILRMISKRLTPNFYTINLEKVLMQIIDDKVLPNSRPAINRIMKNYSLFHEKALNGVEIGVDSGINSYNILNTLNMERLYLIDIWEDYIEGDNSFNYTMSFETVKKRFESDIRVKIIRKSSHEAIEHFERGSLDFVYIDANHDYSHVYQDLSLWTPKIKDNGIVAGHDINMITVYTAVKQFCEENNFVMRILSPDWYFFKI